MKVQKTPWQVSDISHPIRIKSDQLEFQDNLGEFHDFLLIVTRDRIVFGGACNAGFLESGFIIREEGECLDETLEELLSDLEVFYNDGPAYVSRIVHNDRM